MASIENKDGKLNSLTENSGDCFLTSACVQYAGKSDDCVELTTLRRFRDSYMRQTQIGRALIDEYYQVAPKIVQRINTSNKQETYYSYINEVIDRCVNFIENGENEKALTEYRFMTLNLKKIFEI